METLASSSKITEKLSKLKVVSAQVGLGVQSPEANSMGCSGQCSQGCSGTCGLSKSHCCR